MHNTVMRADRRRIAQKEQGFAERRCDGARSGTVTEGPAGMVSLQTLLGGSRLLDLLSGEPLPRIC